MASFSDFTILHPQDHHSGIIQDGRVARECGISTMPQGEARLIGCIDLSPEWKGIINYNAITVPTSVCWLPIPKAIEISWKDVLSLIAPLLPFIINGPHITRSGQMLLLLLPCTGSRKQRSSPARYKMMSVAVVFANRSITFWYEQIFPFSPPLANDGHTQWY